MYRLTIVFRNCSILDSNSWKVSSIDEAKLWATQTWFHCSLAESAQPYPRVETFAALAKLCLNTKSPYQSG